MFGLGLVSNFLGGGGPSKEEKRELEMKASDLRDQRDREERDLDERKRAYAANGDAAAPDGKENKAKVCSCSGQLNILQPVSESGGR